jgi:diaminohydroxyphosphoribosylaminopyrimidine deaminase/5-amino-6-(5-phosphoribosylamino)uracil reductase
MHGVLEVLDDAARRTLLEELAESSRAFRFEVAPNPCVGAAVVAGGKVVSRGYHEAWGEDHAELRALKAAAASGVPRNEWDTLVVTLEPCSSRGKTPPCVDAIIASGIKTIIVGALDPDPRHRGQGLEFLREAGLEVVVLQHAAPLDRVAPHFLRWTSHDRVRRARPWTQAKWAQTLTGQLSPPKDVGEGRWISGPEALAEVQIMRSHVDAIVTGIGTVLADNPRFTVRPPGNTDTPPLRIVLDTFLKTPPEARLFAPPGPGESAGAVHVLSIVGVSLARERALRDAGAEVHGLHGAKDGRLDLRAVQAWLWEHDVRRVLVEAGPTLVASYFDAGFIDQIRVVTGSVRGGLGESLGERLAGARLLERRDGELGEDSVLDAFLEGDLD